MTDNKMDETFKTFLSMPVKVVETAIRNYQNQVNKAESRKIYDDQSRKNQQRQYEIEVIKHNQIMRSS